MLKVSLTEAGGLLPTRSQTVSVSDDQLSGADARRLRKLLKAARDDPPGAVTGKFRDPKRYRVSVVSDGESFELKRTDETGTPIFNELVDWIRQHGG